MMEKGTVIPLEKGKYEITGRIGEGAYGVVWEVRRVSDGEMFALKTVQTRDPDERIKYPTDTVRQITETLQKEIRFLRGIDPEVALKNHIVPMTDSGEHEGRPVMAMMRCENSLNRVYVQRQDMKEGFPFDAQTLAEWLRQLAVGLKKIHSLEPAEELSGENESGIIEIYSPDPDEGSFVIRDLKFKNVLVREGKLYLADFGTVKPLHRQLTKSRVYTPEWAAPETMLPKEIVNGKPRYALTPRVDIYSLGLMFHSLITGKDTQAQEAFFRYPFLNREFGSVGGLTAEEKQVLEQHLRRLLIPGGRTILPMNFVSLPDTETLISEFSALTESMLAPRAENRPSSAKVVDKSRELLDFLAPDLKELRLKMPSPLSFGKKQKVYVQAVGKGLPRSGRWLNLSVNEKPVSADFRPVPEKNQVWESDLPGFDKEGKYEIEVFAIVHHEKISCVQTAEVSASAEQLWKQGLYVQALIKKPDKWEWLNDLEKKFGKSEKYLKILEDVLEVHPKHTDINRRYWPLKHDIESRMGKSGALPTNGGSPHSDENDFRHSGESRNPDKVGNAPLLPTLQKTDKKRKTIGKWLAAGLCLILLFAGVWHFMRSETDRRVGKSGALPTKTVESPVQPETPEPVMPRPEPPKSDPMEEKRRAAGEIWKTIQEYLQSGETEKAKNLLTEKKSGLEILPDAAEKISVLEEFFVFYDRAGKAGKAETSQEQEKIVSDYEKAAEISGKLSISGLHDAVSEKLKAAESVRDDLLAAEKKEQERIAEEKLLKDEQDRIAEAEAQQKRTDAENRYAEIVKSVNSGKWDDAGSMISQNRDLLKNWLDSEKYGHLSQLETFFGFMTDAEKLRAKTDLTTPESFAPVLALYEKAKQIAQKLPAEIKLSVRIQGKMNEVKAKRDELLAKIQKEKEEEERVQKQKEAEGIYANILRAVKNGDRDTAENAISENRSLLSTYLDKTKAGHIRSLENFWKYLDEGDRLAGKRPETEKNLKSAAEAYSNAETTAKNLGGIVSLGDGIAEKRQKVLARRDKLMQEEQDSGAVAGKTVKARDGRFIAYTDGTVYDTKLDITWADTDNGSAVTWQQAYDYCTKTYKGGGWRMPTQDELYSLVGEENGVIKGYDCNLDFENYIITKLIRLTCTWVWAAETKDGPSWAFVNFGFGDRNWDYLNGTPRTKRALPVRSGK
ncbi:MAG: DUF1566 domain-containing protein [Desulfococcaceae bacterium]